MMGAGSGGGARERIMPHGFQVFFQWFGLWRYNSDGIDIGASQDVVIKNCFIRAFFWGGWRLEKFIFPRHSERIFELKNSEFSCEMKF